jgi:hypothetical protein
MRCVVASGDDGWREDMGFKKAVVIRNVAGT